MKRSLEALGIAETVEDLSARLRLPFIPEYEAAYFETLYRPELAAAGVRRLGRGRGSWAPFERAAALLEKRRFADARDMLLKLRAERPSSGLAPLLLGVARERLGDLEGARRAYEAAADANPACSAAFLLRARAGADARDRVRWVHKAYDSCTYVNHFSFEILLRGEQPEGHPRVCTPAYAKKVLDLSFGDPAFFAGYAVRDPLEDRYSVYKSEGVGCCRAFIKEGGALAMAWAEAFLARFSLYDPTAVGEARAAIERAVALSPRSGWIRAWRGNIAVREGKLKEAVADYGLSIALQPHYHLAYAWRGAALHKLGRRREALDDLDRALRMDPNYAFALSTRSLVLRELGDHAGAARDIDHAFRRDVKFGWVYRRGRHASSAELAAGLRELDRGVAASPRCASLWTWRAELLSNLGRVPEALAGFEKARRLDPRHAVASALHGKTLLDLGRLDEAAARLEAALRLDPLIRMTAAWLAECRFRQGRTRDAFAVLEKVLKEHPKTDWPHVFMGEHHLRLGELAKAERSFRRAARINGHGADAYYFLALVAFERGRDAAAAGWLERCLTVAPTLGRAYLLRAALRERGGDAAGALADYRKLLVEHAYLFNDEQRSRVEALLARA